MGIFTLIVAASPFNIGVEQLRSKLMLLAFVLVVLGIWESAWKAGSDPKAILGIFLKTVIIVVLLAGFPTLIKSGKEAFDGLKDTVSPDFQNRFYALIDGDLPKVDPGISSIGTYIASLIVAFLQFWGQLGVQIVIFFQEYAIGCLTAVSPLMIGLLAVSYTQAIGIRFLMTSLCVAMWSLGFVFVDLFLSYLGAGVLSGMLATGVGATVGGIITIVSWPAAIGAMLCAALVPTFFYVATPMAIGKLMAGANAGTAAAWGGLSNLTQTGQHFSRGAEAFQKMQMAFSLRSAGNQSDSKNAASSAEGKIPRPPNPIV